MPLIQPASPSSGLPDALALARTNIRQMTGLGCFVLQLLHDISSRMLPVIHLWASFLPVSPFSPKSGQARFIIASDAPVPNVACAVPELVCTERVGITGAFVPAWDVPVSRRIRYVLVSC